MKKWYICLLVAFLAACTTQEPKRVLVQAVTHTAPACNAQVQCAGGDVCNAGQCLPAEAPNQEPRTITEPEGSCEFGVVRDAKGICETLPREGELWLTYFKVQTKGSPLEFIQAAAWGSEEATRLFYFVEDGSSGGCELPRSVSHQDAQLLGSLTYQNPCGELLEMFHLQQLLQDLLESFLQLQ